MMKNEMYNIDVENMLRLPGKVHVYWKDVKGFYLGSNELMAEVAGFTNRNHIIGVHDFDMFKEYRDCAEKFVNNDQYVIKNNSILQCYEYLKTIENEIGVLSIKTPLINRNNKLIGVFGVSYYLPEFSLQEGLVKASSAGFPICQSDLPKLEKQAILKSSQHFNLTPRQAQCLYYLVRGMTAKQTAVKLEISPRTVESYLVDIKDRLGCTNKADLIAKAIEMGLAQTAYR